MTEERSGFQHTTLGVVLVATILMGVALVENLPRVMWSPFYVGYAGLATMLPLIWGVTRLGPVRAVRWWHWLLAIAVPIALQVVVGLFLTVVYPAILHLAGVVPSAINSVDYSYNAMFGAMIEAAAAKWGVSAQNMLIFYVGFVVVWAGFGEEAFYRGYMHGSLRLKHGFFVATIVSAFFFAIRHYTQMALLWPDFPWPAATAWVSVGFVLGIVMSWLYEKTGSLVMPVLAHYVFNLIPFLGIITGASE